MAQKQRMSYFGEIRQRYNDPAYFNNNSNRPDIMDDIRRNVRRIIKDAANGNIINEDYMYFQSVNLINICIDVCDENIRLLSTENNALMYYMNTVLINNWQPMFVNKQMEHSNLAKLHAETTTRLGIWVTARNAFTGIFRGGNPMQELATLIQLKMQINAFL